VGATLQKNSRLFSVERVTLSLLLVEQIIAGFGRSAVQFSFRQVNCQYDTGTPKINRLARTLALRLDDIDQARTSI